MARSVTIFAFLLVQSCIVHAAVYTPAGGPVYVNPQDVAPAQIPLVPQERAPHVTQTVYGFLDFTTTIGNTVMVFSPQSAPPPDAVKKEDNQVKAVVNVIETKPSTTPKPQLPMEIKPSKTVAKSSGEKKSPTSAESLKKMSSIVEIKSSPHVMSSVVNVQAAPPSSKVETMSSVIEVKEAPVMYSKVEVIEGSSSVTPSVAISSHIEVHTETPHTPIMTLRTEVSENPVELSKPESPVILSSVVEVQSGDNEPALLGNNIGEPEYDFLSRQPSEVVEETYKVINLKPPNSKFHLKPRHSVENKHRVVSASSQHKNDESHPTGLVTKLGGTVVKDGVTTVHETSVIGTFISGKYAQVLQSTSHIYHNSVKPKPTAASSLRILKTAAPSLRSTKFQHLEPTPAGSLHQETSALPLEALFGSSPSPNLIRPSRRPATPGGSYKNRFRAARPNAKEVEQDLSHDEEEQHQEIAPSYTPSFKKSGRRTSSQGHRAFNNRFGRPSTTSSEIATVSVFSETSTPSYSSRRHKSTRNFKPTPSSSYPSSDGYTRRGYKPRVHSSPVEQDQSSTSLYKFKLNRAPGRWQYKTTPKPRVTIRRQSDDEVDNATVPSTTGPDESAPQNNDIVTPQSRSDDLDLETQGTANGLSEIDEDTTDNNIDKQFPIETIKVEISTPADFKNTYYEIATIKSPYTFQVGTIKNTRYITTTSTLEKHLENTDTPSISPSATEPLTENILATTSHLDKEHNLLDASIATLPPIILGSDVETPPLETLTETFSTTTVMLKTHILPVIRDGNSTSSYTLVQTYHVTRLVTATKTLPPMEVYQFVPSKTLNEFNSRLDEAGSELHLELEFGDDNDQDGGEGRRVSLQDLDLANVGSDFDLSDVDKSKIPDGHLRLKKANAASPKQQQLTEAPPVTPNLSPEQLQQLAILRFLNPAAAAQIPQVITTSKPVLKLETVYESHVIPVVNGLNTAYSTISRPVATVSKTEYEYGTSTLSPAAFPVPQVNPLFPQQQQQFQLTSTPVVTQMLVTATESKILKLTFGAKTAYTTLFSTRVVPTAVTTYLTASVPVQPTAAFPGFFPAPYPQPGYPQFPYVG